MSSPLDHECAHALLGADHVRERLLSMLAMGEYNIVNTYYAVKCRVKSKSSLKSKIERKRTIENKPTYTALSATDIVGLRILTLYSNDIVPASRDFIDFVQTCQNPTVRLFSGSKLDHAIREIIVYQSKTNTRHYTTALRAFEKLPLDFTDDGKLKVRSLDATDEQPYSSIHIVCNAVSFYGDEPKIVPVEIQIRTVFEDAWNEVDHPIRYKGLRDKKSHFEQDERKTANLIIDQLGKFKSHLDACGGDADNIRERYDHLMVATTHTGDDVPASHKLFEPDRDIVIDTKTGFKDPKSKREFERINARIQKLFMTPASSVELLFDQLHSEAVNLIAALDESAESYRARDQSRYDADYDFGFCTQAQKAFILLWQAQYQYRAGRGTRHQLEALMSEVLFAYRSIEESHPYGVSSFLKFRISTSLYNLSAWDEAIAEMELAVQALDSDPYLPNDSRLHFIARRQLGIACWRKRQKLWHSTQSFGANSILHSNQCDLLERALSTVHQASKVVTTARLTKDEKQLETQKCLSNAACFVWELQDLGKDVTGWMNSFDMFKSCDDLPTTTIGQLDTSMKVCELTGNPNKSVEHAVSLRTRLPAEPLFGVSAVEDSKFLRYSLERVLLNAEGSDEPT